MPAKKISLIPILFLFLLQACRPATDGRQPGTEPPTTSALPESTQIPEETGPVATQKTDPAAEATLASAESSDRSQLTYAELTDGFAYSSPVQESAFRRPANAQPAPFVFEGRLELIGEASTGKYKLVRGSEPLERELYQLPEFDFRFVQVDGHLVPVRRGRIVTEHPTWNYILGPGKVWGEPGDRGFARASFPFTLVPKGGNSTYSGTMTFLFNDQEASLAWYQVTQETSFYLRMDTWGLLEAAYHPQEVDGAAAIKESFTAEIAARYPARPIEALAEAYPEVDIQAFGRGLAPAHLNAYAFAVDGVSYVSGCHTRYGPYTYCESMRFASWSTAKSAFAGMAMMRLSQEFGPDAAQILIKDFVPEAAGAPGDWSQVTLNNILDMATGNYESARRMEDENDFTSPFWAADDYSGMMTAAFDWPQGAAPGTQWVYHTSDTFIAVGAMQAYLDAQTGAGRDIFQYMAESVYTPIGIGPGTLSTARTSDNGWQGLPLGGLGLWWTLDDIPKIADLLHRGGDLDGVHLLEPGQVAAALQKDPNDRGVRINQREMYNNGFWATRYGPNEGYGCEFWVAEMQGISGVVVVLLPNGTTYYYFSDNQEFTWDAAVRESDKMIPFCK